MKLSKFRVVLLGLLVAVIAGMAGVYVFRAPIKATVNEYRAERIFTRAQEAFAAEKWAEASRLGIAAHHLDPANTQIDLLVARSLLQQRNAATVAWWKLVLDEPELPVDELRELTKALLAARDVDEALPFLSRLVELDGDNPETQQLWLASLQLQHRYDKVRALAGTFAQGGSEDWNIHSAYIRMQRSMDADAGLESVVTHLDQLIAEAGSLALPAAREMIFLPGVSSAHLLDAANYLKTQSENPVDQLLASGVEIKETGGSLDSALPYLNRILDDPQPGDLDKVFNWAKWMGAGSWILDKIDWQTHQEFGGTPDPFLGLLLAEGMNAQLLELTEAAASEGGDQMTAFLYYRSIVLQETGETEEARSILNLAVQTVDPEHYRILERYLARDGQWQLLSDLYDILLENNPEEPVYIVKALSSRYYSGDHDALPPLLQQADMEAYQAQPDAKGFILYLKLLQEGSTPEIHNAIEGLMAAFPNVYDFRLILGVSYTLQGQRAQGRELIADMPPLGMNAPRYIRVAAVILGNPADDLLRMTEREVLLPREKFLISIREQ
ncbi:MAG: hypothetical protein AB3N64_01880 [Puniceicoccaceae bacterium]